MKLFKRSPNGKLVQIGEDPKTAKWYKASSSELEAKLKDIQDGEEITVAYEQRAGSYCLTFVEKGKVDVPANLKTSAQEERQRTDYSNKQEYKKTYGKTPAEQNSIRNQAIGKMTAETLKALQGIVAEDNVEKLIEKIYKKYKGLVNEADI